MKQLLDEEGSLRVCVVFFVGDEISVSQGCLSMLNISLLDLEFTFV